MSERTKAVYRQIIDAIGAGDERAVGRHLRADIVDRNPMPGQARGVEGFLDWLRGARTSFPDLETRVEAVLSEGDLVAGRVAYAGTHGGPLGPLAPTHRRVTFQAIHIVRFDGEQIVEWWGASDVAEAVREASELG